MTQTAKGIARAIALSTAIAPVGALAAAPTVVSIDPPSQVINASRYSVIEVVFDQAISVSSVNDATLRVFGRWSGPATGTIDVDGAIVTFTPDEPFFAGEWVTVSLSKGIKNTLEEALAHGYAWNFWTHAQHGDLNMDYSGRVTCRQGGESWVQVYGAYAGDLNNDGWTDLAAPCEQTHDVRLFMNNGAGSYTTFTKRAVPSGQTTSPNEGADFDNDGEIDLVVGSTGSDKVSVMFGDGTGDFPTGTAYTAGSSVRGVGVVDLNGDGWDDFVTANRFASNISVFMNNCDGTFAPGVVQSGGGANEFSIGVADANNDGLLDVIVGCFTSPYNITVLLSDGDGALTLQTPAAGGGPAWQMAVGDFNNDGNVDAAVNNTNQNRIAVHFGDGMGGLSAPNYASVGSFPLAIDAGDLDGDGDLEIVSSNYSSATWTILKNTAGAFGNPVTLNAASAGSCAILHDRDNDGDLDLTGLDEQDDWIYMFTNNPDPTAVATAARSAIVSVENHPNPFNPATAVRFELAVAADVELSVFDAAGGFVATIESGRYPAGVHEVRWNGTDARGQRVSSGVYFCRLSAGAAVETRKMVLLK